MTKYIPIRILGLLSIYLFCSIAHADLISNKKTELHHIAQQINRVKTGISQQSKQQTDLQQQLKITEISLGELNERINHINQLQISEQQELTKLNIKQKNARILLAKQRNGLAQQIRAAYLLGQSNEIKILFNQENPYTLNRHLSYYRYLTKNHVSLITEINNTLLTLTNTLQAITQHQHDLQSLLQQNQQQVDKQQAAQQQRQHLLSQLNLAIHSKEQQLSLLLEDQNTLQDTLKQLQTQRIDLLDHQPFSQLHGKLQWPAKGTILANFGSRLDVENQRLSGVIIRAPEGTPVRAISAGKVMFATWLRGFGLLVIINHGNGFMSVYARNQSIAVKMGEDVKSGDIIAKMGASGGHITSSLYFEIRQNGIPINPSLWCRYT